VTEPFLIRGATPADVTFMARMLVEANHGLDTRPRPTVPELLHEPMIGRFLVGWGRPGDTGVIAVRPDGVRCGAAWYRLLTADEPGWVYLDDATPELTIAVTTRARGRGVGTALMAALIERARSEGRPGVTLSVSLGNPVALALYRRAGFQSLSEGHGWATMVWRPTPAGT